MLWYGGLWNWLDPVTPVRALPALLERRPGAHLAFLGKVPAEPSERGAADRARAVARELGAAAERVHFLDAVAPYEQRGAWLTDAACAVSAHRAHLETRFAFRTRMLDFIWAGLPGGVHGGRRAVGAGRARRARRGRRRRATTRAWRRRSRACSRRAATPMPAAFAGAAEAFAWPRVTAPLARMVTAAELPPRLGDAALVPALPGPAVARAADPRAAPRDGRVASAR